MYPQKDFSYFSSERLDPISYSLECRFTIQSDKYSVIGLEKEKVLI